MDPARLGENENECYNTYMLVAASICGSLEQLGTAAAAAAEDSFLLSSFLFLPFPVDLS